MVFFDEVQTCPDVITWIKLLVDEGSCRYALSGRWEWGQKNVVIYKKK